MADQTDSRIGPEVNKTYLVKSRLDSWFRIHVREIDEQCMWCDYRKVHKTTKTPEHYGWDWGCFHHSTLVHIEPFTGKDLPWSPQND